MAGWRPLALPRLRSGRPARSTLATLDDRLRELTNARGGAGLTFESVRDAYLDWVDTSESYLRDCFVDREPIEDLLSVRYWHLRSMTEGSPRHFQSFYAEMETQKRQLTEFRDQLAHELEAFGLAEDEVVLVLDTNVFLHYRQIDHIQWHEEFPDLTVRLVIPLPVLNELDEKKYDRVEKTRRTAAASIRLLRELRGTEHPEVPVPIGGRDNPMMQILMDPAGHRRVSTMDDEILDRAEHLASVVDGQLVVGSADHGFHSGAVVRGLKTWWPDDGLKRRDEKT